MRSVRRLLVVVLCVGLVSSSVSCIAPVALGAAGAAAGAGAQAGWWFGKTSKDAAQDKANERKEATHDKDAAQ